MKIRIRIKRRNNIGIRRFILFKTRYDHENYLSNPHSFSMQRFSMNDHSNANESTPYRTTRGSVNTSV